VGRRSFTFDPSSIRLRTDKKLVIVHGTPHPTNVSGGWRWTHEYDVHEGRKAALRRVGVVMRDELARRFPTVNGPQDAPADRDEDIILRPLLDIPPDLDLEPRLELEVTHLATKTLRKFTFKTSAGREHRTMYFSVAAADLAVQAASSPEVLEFLVSVTQAVPE
jgi:hypothetical protein